jgi:hypothetical protein
MSPESLFQSAGSAFSGRFSRVAVLPAALAFGYLLLLVRAGAPGPVHFASAWHSAAGLGVGGALVLLPAVVAVGVVTVPLQLPLVRLLQGYWPARLDPLARRWAGRQLRHRNALTDQPPAGADERELQLAGERGALRRSRFPEEDHLVRPTALGNAIVAAESRAGAVYGFDAPAALLRLEPVLGERVRDALTDRRNALDATVRISVTAALLVPPTLWLLWRSGWWLLLAALLAAVSRLAYTAAVHAAVAYGECLAAAFDLHRFDLLGALHLPLPADPDEERRLNHGLTLLWRQNAGQQVRYAHDPDRPPPP